VFAAEPIQVSLAGFIAFEEKHCRFTEGPFEVGVSDLFAACAVFSPLDSLAHFTRRA
jgi:hypothetical protein